MTAWAQEFPRAEIGANYSYADYGPSAPYSQRHGLNGGGGELNININEFLSLKMDLQGYGSHLDAFHITPNSTFPGGVSGSVEGNLFTYLFGPQLKVRAHHLQPYGHLLFGGAHTNVYGNAFHTICQPIVNGCSLSKSPAAEAFAMDCWRWSRHPGRQALCNSSVPVRLPLDPIQQSVHRREQSEQFPLFSWNRFRVWPHPLLGIGAGGEEMS